MKSALVSWFVILGLAFGAPALLAQSPLSGYQKGITYLDEDSNRHVWVFTETLDGRMVSKHFDSKSWVWMDHGKPPGRIFVGNSQPLTYLDSTGNRRIYVFAVDDEGKMRVRYDKGDGSGWKWSGGGGMNFLGATLSSTTYIDYNGDRRVQVFGVGAIHDNPNIYRVMSLYIKENNVQVSFELPDLAGSTLTPASFTANTNYLDADGNRRVMVFTKNSGNELVRFTSLQNIWTGTNLGGTAFTPSGAINHLDTAGTRHTHAVVRNPGTNDLWDRRGTSATALPHPAAVGSAPLQGLSLINYTEADGDLRMDLYASYSGHGLYRRVSIDDTWYPWVHVGLPPGTPQAAHNPSAMTYLDSRGGLQHKYVFILGPESHLWANFWDGMVWQWIDLGLPP
jgi:hypothetical protein